MKKIFFNISNKGGVGKSTLSKAQAELYREDHLVSVYDTDIATKSLKKLYEEDEAQLGCALFDIRNDEQRDLIIDDIYENKSEIIIIDLPAGAVDVLNNFLDGIHSFIALLQEKGYEVFFNIIVTQDFETLETVNDLFQVVKDIPEISFNVVLNEDKISDEKIRAEIEGVLARTFFIDGIVMPDIELTAITIPSLKPAITYRLKKSRQTVKEYLNGEKLPITEKLYLQNYLKRCKEQLMKLL